MSSSKYMNPLFVSIVLFIVLMQLTGCTSHLATCERMDKGLVLILPGIEGRSVWNYELALGLDEGGVESAIEIYDWCTPVPMGWWINLMDIQRNRKVAGELAQAIVEYKRKHPQRDVHLVGMSGGAGIAILAAERLPEKVQLKSMILLCAAVGPDYDLTEALEHCDEGIHSFYTEHDRLLLGAGTSILGTIDRSYGPAAGKVGFRCPEDATPRQKAAYQKLRQIEWSPDMLKSGNIPSHGGWCSRPFVKEYLAPLMRNETSSG